MNPPTLHYDRNEPHRTVRRIVLRGLNIVACLVVIAIIMGLIWATWLPAMTAGKK